jgi:Gpi18-like mannosyltransferase
MKKGINIEEILNYVAIEKAPDDLIYKWKAEVALQKERKSFSSVLLRPSIVIPLIFAGFWYYFIVFRKELFDLYLLDKIRAFFLEVSPVASDSINTIASSNYYIIAAGIFSVFIAAVSLFWFFRESKLRYSKIKIW